MQIPEGKMVAMLAYEAFLRRASEVDLPFMLKGSYVTRQYFPDPNERIPNDLDWVYLLPLSDAEEARKTFDHWVTQVTETYERDGVQFQSFKKNAFWRMIDYAMADDFPTINTDLKCWVDGEEFDWFGLDISFNLEVEVSPVPLYYKPLRGEPFTIPQTVPLALQIAWKLHQTLVRPRYKDIFDLTHLLQHPAFNEQTMAQTLQALVNECSADNVNVRSLHYLIEGQLQPLFREVDSKAMWEFWRFGKSKKLPYDFYEKAQQITDAEQLPSELSQFVQRFQSALNQAGFTASGVDKLPAPIRQKPNERRAPGADVKNVFSQENTTHPLTPKDEKQGIMGLLRKLFK